MVIKKLSILICLLSVVILKLLMTKFGQVKTNFYSYLLFDTSASLVYVEYGFTQLSRAREEKKQQHFITEQTAVQATVAS